MVIFTTQVLNVRDRMCIFVSWTGNSKEVHCHAPLLQAPGYTQIIKRPMSFSQMRDRLAKEEYTSWRSVQEDLETMFNNAMVFNGPKTPYHLKVGP